ncbi:hypothetical protein TorRG33x02_005370 [Trema orientale]|uniref:Secreted protein n=1 Tax=Trema orientale TaxID=63057 RepID=A0A2P5FZX9_TREOI|nr:hypothetical protein TorRG33x02_005370 [Trema orientale]
MKIHGVLLPRLLLASGYPCSFAFSTDPWRLGWWGLVVKTKRWQWQREHGGDDVTSSTAMGRERDGARKENRRCEEGRVRAAVFVS